MTAQAHPQPVDALDLLDMQDEVTRELLDRWSEATAKLTEADSVEVRWERGSAGKLLLQHLAVRESAKEAIAGRLRAVGEGPLADRFEGEGPQRRRVIDRLDELIRGHQAIAINSPLVDAAVRDIDALVTPEITEERSELVPAAASMLGAPGERGLPSARSIRLHSPTHPSPEPRWHDRIGPLKALRALYDHLRGSPSGVSEPGVDIGREQTPGLRSDR